MFTASGIAERLALPVPILPRRENSKWATYGLSGQGWYMVYDLDEEGPDAVIPHAILAVQLPFRVGAIACRTRHGCQLGLWKYGRRSGLRRLMGTLALIPRGGPRRCAFWAFRMLGIALERWDEEWLYSRYYRGPRGTRHIGPVRVEPGASPARMPHLMVLQKGDLGFDVGKPALFFFSMISGNCSKVVGRLECPFLPLVCPNFPNRVACP